MKKIILTTTAAMFIWGGISLGNVQGGWGCRAAVAEAYKEKTKAPLYFSTYGPIDVDFGKKIDDVVPGDKAKIHDQMHVVTDVKPFTVGFKVFDFKTVEDDAALREKETTE
jgi:hypothetical protein